MVSTFLLVSFVSVIFGAITYANELVPGFPPPDDIILSPEQKAAAKVRGAYVWAKLWPNATVPYMFDASMNARARSEITNAINQYNAKTCIRIIPKTAAHKAYIKIYNGGNGICNSAVGTNGGEQLMSIGKDCEYSSVYLHEFGHAIGFMHEHQRPDRDQYITMNYGNVIKGYEQWLQAYAQTEANLQNIAYDYNSIMHYRRNAFTANGGDTMVPKDPKMLNVIGDKPEFSKCDLEKNQQIVQMYKLHQKRRFVLDKQRLIVERREKRNETLWISLYQLQLI